MVEIPKQGEKSGTEWNLKEMRKSAQDKMIAGVCGGLGEYTPIPSWIWRVVFFVSIFWGGGVILYAALWVWMPSAETNL